MLAYYKNALNFVFFNESIIVCAILSKGLDVAWREGMDLEELFRRSCYLSELLKREEVIEKRLIPKDR